MYWELGFLRVFLCTIVSPYFIVKSLQLRGRRQIVEPRKYCLVRVIVFFDVCFLYLFCFSQVGILVKFPTWVTDSIISASHTLVVSLAPFLWLYAVGVHGQGWWCMCGGFGREATEGFRFGKEREIGPIWYTISNIRFQFLNNITRIFIHFFTHTYFKKNKKLLFKHTYQMDPSYFELV